MYSPETVIIRNKLFTLWHIDPCLDGSDDSCGWSSAKLNKEEKEKIKSFAEYDFGVINDIYKVFDDNHRIQVLYTLYSGIKWTLYKKRLKMIDIKNIMSFAWNIFDDIKIYNDRPKDDFERLCFCLARHVKTQQRKWYQHPRFHIHHWKFQWNKKISRS